MKNNSNNSTKKKIARLRNVKNILVTNSVLPDPGKKIPKKKAKKIKKLKNIVPPLFLSKPGLDSPRKREKNFSPEFRSYLTRATKFQKKKRKNF